MARFDGMREHLETWRKLLTQLGATEISYRNAVCRQTARAGWTGMTSGVADDSLERVAGRIGIAAVEAKSIHTALVPVADEFQRLQNLLNGVLGRAQLDGLSVTAQGEAFTVATSSSTPLMAPDAAAAVQTKLDSYRVEIEGILRQATEADARFAGVLASLLPGEVNGADYAASLQNVKDDLRRAAGLQGAGPIPPA
ncbi:hypothetical protein [Yinghuangia soli]|uniref:Uncharacterized protein n=1 Tax=Yinghuangia soli TaxID=2908204 RepID=A0AA41Q4A9_9ACTN|nr:hypothetical protein [Yinghuangia soli]MCF2530947.1 hypothetical protein [Yinghuangia soli]